MLSIVAYASDVITMNYCEDVKNNFKKTYIAICEEMKLIHYFNRTFISDGQLEKLFHS